ncbi:type IV pilin [Natrononativus amylolyticus]|uniref:type IV pilin n=1 Tax=Natrononativus amylolyticus TaxID=2963434 RepID=UPI0020CBDBD8|nr:type IV pilin N-terminal domain-containing protein [Natrononativus amylolyticus]
MNFAKKLIGNEEERAVSPVIGVILMVAITVILAAVIAAFVLDMGQSQSGTANAGVSISESGGDYTIQLTDSGNSEYVVLSGVSEGTGDCHADSDSFGEDAGDCVLENVGDSATTSNPDGSVVAVAGDDRNVINNWP